ncbi:bifunctional DNA primase/polymerase [Halegenticoccus soli]|uniref:hypothetical protein n=1 Tax=Halegenticoccus soli TaxID=1985678 RepID=UPI000C6C8FEC|nr:hypothetical protein [Halegenticoccus soli]
MSAESDQTTDHETIRNWVEERNGHPAHVEGTGGDDPGLLRIDFEDADDGDESLEEISWDEFFEAFEENDLAFLYQEETDEGEESRFCKLVGRGD